MKTTSPITSVPCPKCGEEIALTEVLIGPLRDQVARELRPTIEEEAASGVSGRLDEMAEVITELRAENRTLKDEEVELRRERRRLEEERAEHELAIERAVDEERQAWTAEADTRAAERYDLQLREQEEKITRLTKDLEGAQLRLTQGPNELRGTVQEAAIEDRLLDLFPGDTITRVGKGRAGADVVHVVRDASGCAVGTILWESKRTKSFGKDWIATLKENARQKAADFAVLISAVVPDDLPIALRDGVYVAELGAVDGLAEILRCQLLALSKVRVASELKDERAGVVYDYVTGQKFTDRILGIAEPMVAEWNSIQQERATLEKRWADREESLHRQLRHLAGLYGDLQGSGAELATVPVLELPA